MLLVALLLLVAALGAIGVLAGMRYRTDSLLYARPKAD